MSPGGWAMQVWTARPAIRWVLVGGLILINGLISYASVELRPPEAIIATWWPAAGVAAVTLLAAKGIRPYATVGIMATSAIAQLETGRELSLILGYAIANAIEAAVFVAVLSWRRRSIRLDGIRDVGRLLVATAAGAATIAVTAAAVATVVAGADYGQTALGLLASHGTALIVIAPIALVTWRRVALRTSIEASVQVVALVSLALIIFWPGNNLPVTYLMLPVMLWAAFRLPMQIVALQLIALAVITTVLTEWGGGPFAVTAFESPRTAITLAQLFISIYALAALLVSAGRNDSASLYERLQARESLLRTGIVNSDSGILIAEIDHHRFRLVGANSTALTALGLSGGIGRGLVEIALDERTTLFDLPDLDALVKSRTSGRLELERDDRRFDVDVTVYPSTVGTEVATMVFTDVTARDERERRALAAADALRDLNRQKDDFIASVSHELRTPVTSILGFAEDLESADLSSQERVASDVIARNARRLADVIEDVLELSRLSSSTSALGPSVQVDLGDVLRKAMQDAEGLSPERKITFEYRGAADPVLISTEPRELGRVLANLFSNAGKFSPFGGTVVVELARDHAGASIAIRDDGPGIPAAEIEAVWDRFYRVQGPQHRDVPGTGLGLPIVRTLVEARLGGTVSLKSGPGSGTTAHLWLPFHREPGSASSTATGSITQAAAKGAGS